MLDFVVRVFGIIFGSILIVFMMNSFSLMEWNPSEEAWISWFLLVLLVSFVVEIFRDQNE